MKSSTRSTEASRWATVAALAIVGPAGVILIFLNYRFRPTVGTGFLALAWISITCFLWFGIRAAQALFHGEGLATGTLDDRRREELMHEKKQLLKAIKEIEFDQATGKIDEVDAHQAISRYRGRALEILRALEEGHSPSLEREIEKELARRLAGDKAPAPRPATCPACATPTDHDAAFCKRCGHRL